MGHYEGKKRGREIGDQKETNSGNNDKKKKLVETKSMWSIISLRPNLLYTSNKNSDVWMFPFVVLLV